MASGTIWERELKWPKSGLFRWLRAYFLVVVAAGFTLWLALGFTSPTTPDPASGKVYEVPGGRRSPPFYVNRLDAYALRFATAHLAVLIAVGGAVSVWNAGARVATKTS